jgi:endonuclease/exonuclease/phosphatase family metal-dependent hydrolase
MIYVEYRYLQWPGDSNMPRMRLDYIFANADFLSSRYDISAGVDISEDTQHMSDHFPVYFSWTTD